MNDSKTFPKVIMMTGGVLSGLGKGITLSSIGFFFSEHQRVVPIKLDGYLNSDPGTMNPHEHGEVFVLEDGFEVDMDFGHYERFLGVNATKSQSLTMGRVFENIKQKERNGEFLGKTVQMIPHVTNYIQEYLLNLAKEKQADVLLVEIGGTIGDIENDLFVESLRQLEHKIGKENFLSIHLSYVPIPFGVNEQKSKPTQQSISLLHNKGIWPQIIIGRCEQELQEKLKEKIALFSSISPNNVFTAPDMDSVYLLPNYFKQSGLIDIVSDRLNLKIGHEKKLKTWNSLLKVSLKEEISILIGGKYVDLEDSYASIVESLKHCEKWFETNINIVFEDTTNGVEHINLEEFDAIIIPGGFGSRGVEGKIELIKYARENKVPFLGICYGLQLAVVEFARNVCGISKAQTMEVDSKAKELLITLLDEQKNIVEVGGTMRLGSYTAKIENCKIKELYSNLNLTEDNLISERHRHRFEVNPEYIEALEKNGLKIVAKSIERDLVECIELDNHSYFVATQSHPELKSKLEQPAPLFYGLVEAALHHKHK
mgnify:CR=1 FL=1